MKIESVKTGQTALLAFGTVAAIFALLVSGCGAEESSVETGDSETAAVVVENTTPGRDRGAGAAGLRDQFLAAAAEQLEVTVEALTEAVGWPPNMEAAAEKLGIAIDKIQEAFPRLGQGGFGNGFADREAMFSQAAETLGITVEDLTAALGTPPDIEGAAKKLEISVEKLQEALPLLRGGFGNRTPRQ